MAGTLAALGRNDLRSLRRESLLSGIVMAPLVWIAMVRFGTPPVADVVADRHGVDLIPYYPLILTGFLLLTSPIVVGGLGAFLVLDERDSGTITVLRVTPTPMLAYLGYRAATILVITAVYVVATMAASGLLSPEHIPGLIPIGLLAGVCGILISLLLLAFARNKVEGIAVMRGIGIVLAGLPLMPYFLGPQWQVLFWVLPTYWPAKAYWQLSDGATWWPYLIGGLVVQLPMIHVLVRRFLRSLG